MCYSIFCEVTCFFNTAALRYLFTNTFAVTIADYLLNVWVFSASLHANSEIFNTNDAEQRLHCVNTSTLKPAVASNVKNKN